MVIYKSIEDIFDTEESLNWWNNFVKKTREQIAEALKDYKPIKPLTCYLYNKQGELVKTFNQKKECAKYLKGCQTTIRNYLNKQWIYKGYLLSLEELTKDQAIDIYKHDVEHGKVYLEGSTQKKIPIFSYNSEGDLVAAYESKYQWCKQNGQGVSILSRDKVINGRLVSQNKYTKEVARRIYSLKKS